MFDVEKKVRSVNIFCTFASFFCEIA